MSTDLILRLEELESNPAPRIAVALVLDVSGSMSGEPISSLNEGVSLFYDAVKDDEIACQSAEVCVVTFGDSIEVVQDFRSIEYQYAPKLLADGYTPMGSAVNKALELLEKRKQEYQQTGVDYFQPWLVLMTDGCPTEPSSVINDAAQRVVSLENAKRLTVFPIGVGNDVDMSVLSKFSSKKSPLKLKGLNFSQFFEWLSKSVAQISSSTPGDTIKLDTSGIANWADI